MRLLVVLALVASALASGPAAAAASAEVPHLLVRVENVGDEGAVGRLSIVTEDGALVYEDEVALPAGELSVFRVDAPYGRYLVRLNVTDEGAPPRVDLGPLGGTSMLIPFETPAANHACPGPFAVGFEFAMASYFATGDRGCLVPTEPFLALLDEARSARHGILRGASYVPLPGSMDRGVYIVGDNRMPFEWRDGATWIDASGRPVAGAEVTYTFHGASGAGVGSMLGGSVWAGVEETLDIFRYEPSQSRPSAWSRTDPRIGDTGLATSAVQLAREVRYDPTWRHETCLFRNGLQGTSVRPGDVVDDDVVCPLWPGGDWQARDPIDWKGLRAMPLYQIEDSADRLRVARILLLDDVPYPVAFESYTLPSGGIVRAVSATLERLELAGEPLDATPLPPAPAPALAPIDPLRGPADPSPRFGFTLAQASDAARADPLLSDVARVVARPDAALVGAAYAEHEQPGTPTRRETWVLAFRAGPDLAFAACERGSAAGLVAVPTVRCTQPSSGYHWYAMYDFASPLFDAPGMTRADLPAAGASFDAAFERWDAVRPDGPGQPPNFAVYRGWPDEFTREPPQLAVGVAPPRAFASALAEATGSGDYAALLLDDATTLAAVELAQLTARFDPADLGLLGEDSLSARGPDAPYADALPYLVASGIGLALLALLGILLYSRLVRSRVLDSATRAQILDAVAAEPGLHASAIRERIGKRGGVGDYHLDVLVREGFLTSLATPGFRRYFVTGKHAPQEMRAIAALREGQNEKLLAIIRANPGIPLQTLALEAGVSVPFASRSVRRLAEAGLVEKVQVGRALTLHAAEG